MKKIFMTCYGGGHAEIIKEVYKNLVNISGVEITILALTTSKYKFEQEKIPYKLITDYYNKEEEKFIYELGKSFCISNDIDTSIGEDETYLYHGYALYELEKKYSKEKIKEGFKKFGRAIFLPIQFMERVLKNENPDLVITTNSPRYEKATLIVAKNLDIVSLSIEDLFGVEYKQLTVDAAFFFKNLNYNTIYGNYLCILTDEVKKNLNTDKIDKVFITGNPAFDKTIKYFNNINKNVIENNIKTINDNAGKEPVKVDKEIIELLVYNNVYLTVSIDGPQAIHDRSRVYADGRGSFSTIIKKLQWLRDTQPEYFGKYVSFNTVLSELGDFTCVDDFFSAKDLFEQSVIGTTFYNDTYIKKGSSLF